MSATWPSKHTLIFWPFRERLCVPLIQDVSRCKIPPKRSSRHGEWGASGSCRGVRSAGRCSARGPVGGLSEGTWALGPRQEGAGCRGAMKGGEEVGVADGGQGAGLGHKSPTASL